MHISKPQPATSTTSAHVLPFLGLSADEALEFQRDTAGWMQVNHAGVIATSIKEVEGQKEEEKQTPRIEETYALSRFSILLAPIGSRWNNLQKNPGRREQEALQTLELSRSGPSKAQKDRCNLDMKLPTPSPLPVPRPSARTTQRAREDIS